MYHFSVIVLFLSFFLFSLLFVSAVNADDVKDAKPKDSEKWKKKDIRDYTEADLERLYEQWEEEDDEPLEPDELPEWKRPQPQIDFSKINPEDPESMLKMTKTGKTLMMFATISGSPTEKETESVSQLWQSSLFNAHYDVQRYVVASDRVLFVLKDGSAAWDIKDFLVRQDRCESVTIEGKDYPGLGASKKEKDEKVDASKKKKTKGTDSKKKKTRPDSDIPVHEDL